MNVIDKNEGKKIRYEVTGNKITFGDDEITLNLEKYERDEDVTIDICTNEDHILIAGLSQYYVANITIPARSYDENGEAVPFDIENVTLVLWALVNTESEV